MLDRIKQLFRKDGNKVDVAPHKPATANVKTSPLADEKVDNVGEPSILRMHPPQFVVGCAQSVGKQRDHNEDTLFCMNTILADGGLDMPFGVFIIADGMGGHQFGEVASGAAARVMADYVIEKMYMPFLRPEVNRSSESVQEVMEQGVKAAQLAVMKTAPGGGTTLTAGVIVGEQLTIAQVGDSRAYFIYPDGRMITITKDHSLVRRLVELGQITEAEALIHPNRNVLYRAMGQSEPFRPDIETRQLPHPGYILLCSEGLWGVVSDDQIFNIIINTKNPSEACAAMVNAANVAGGPDNISVILVQYL